VERSDRGFRLLTEEQYDEVKASGNYIEGNEDAKITWLEYSDLQCPYCAKLYEE
jgi:protein-disulfide isomerase